MHTQSTYRLLVVRLGAMGDILHALPAVAALRRAHPEWRIGWVVDPRWAPLLTAGNWAKKIGNRTSAGIAGYGIQTMERGPEMPVVDWLHLAQTREWKKRPLSPATAGDIAALRRELRAAKYQAVLDLQGTIRSAAIARLSGCQRRIGEAQPREWPARLLFTEQVTTHGAHVIEQDLELASAVAGDALAAERPPLPVDREAESWCDNWLAETFAGRERPIALLVPGAGWGAKRWPAERYAVVARGLATRGMHVAVNSGPGELPLVAEIVSSGVAVPLVASLPQLIALTRRVALCIGGDTGPLHLACALGRSVVGIYGPTDPSRNGPYGTRMRVLRNPESRRDHTRREAPEAGLLTIQPEEVLSAADELLVEEERR